LTNLLKENVQQLPSGKNLLVLDCGCGQKPYFPFFESKSSLYVGIDREKTKEVDVLGDAESLPFKDSLFDVVLCTQVLEHALSPSTLIDEIHRVLKKGGFLFLSTHGVWPVHDPHFDFWRWTHLGLRKMLVKFPTVRLYNCGGGIASFFQMVNWYVPNTRYVRPFIAFFLNKIGESLDHRFGNKVSKIIVNYLAIAKK
jgi:ubiquinone/menaquinone biosynthesis C-methylase UbiE